MSKLNNQVRSGLRKNPEALLEDLRQKVSSESDLEAALDKISALLSSEEEKIESRKKLSRMVGAARKEGSDPADLISQVSAISAEIKSIKTQVDEKIAGIESMQGEVARSSMQESSPEVPAHLVPANRDNPEFDPASLQFSHSDVIDTHEWQAFVDSVRHSTVYHDADWCELIKTVFGHTPHYISCRTAEGKLCGVFPTVHLKSRLFGSFMVSMPYFNYGGPLSEYSVVESRLLEYASELGNNLECSHLEVRDTAKRDNWLAKESKVTMILPLPASDIELDKNLGSKVRAQVSRAAKEGLVYTCGGEELLDRYYRVFSRNMRDLGTPVYSKQFFSRILRTFPDKANLAIVEHQGEPVAVGFLLGHNDKLEIPWASSLRAANPLGANMYMYRQILGTSINKGYKYFDFGRSSIGASTHKFKKQWGAVEYPLYWHYWLKDADELPELNPNNPKYKLVIKMWQQLPVAVANVVGPKLVRNLP